MLKTFKNLFKDTDEKLVEEVVVPSETVAAKKMPDRKMTDVRAAVPLNAGAWSRPTIKPAGIREVQYEGVSKHNTINGGTLELVENTTKKKTSTKSKNKNAVRVAINGFGRIGRAFLKVAINEGDIDIVAVNDLGDIHNMAYLLTYDTVYKKSDFDITVEEKSETEKYLHIKNSKRTMTVQFISQRDPTLLPWKDLKVDVVVESTGLFTAYDKANVHISSGAKRVVISAPAKGGEDVSINGETVLMAINEEKIHICDITSNASCTTNASSPIIAILDEAIGIKKAILNTVHAYTASQSIVDGPNKKDYREGRAAAQNIVPSSTGAAIAVTKAFTQLEGKFDGVSMRVPVPAGSIADITFIANRNTTVEEINTALVTAAKSDRWKGIFDASNEELVSSDIQGSPFASIADLKMTRVVDGDLVKVLAWYDNEMGYTHTLVRHVKLVGQYIKSKY